MKTLTINDLQLVQPYIDEANYTGYNSNFVTMMMWNHEYHIVYEIVDDALIMLLQFDGHAFFSMPFCKRESICNAVDWMINYCKNQDIEFSMSCVIEEVKDILVSYYGASFKYLCNDDSSDYIYSYPVLMTLSGKKMQKRRNHFNSFCKQYPNYLYKEIEDQDIDHVLSCLKRWKQEHEYHELLDSEYIGITTLLNNRSNLPIKTGCIYINGQVEAFTIASMLPHRTLQIHVEKANKNIRGLYVAINKLFLENNYHDSLFVNREEDMGILSLRKAKQAMHPISMIKKYSISFNNYVIEKIEDKEFYEVKLKELWLSSFEDEDHQSMDYYFRNHYPSNDCFVVKSNDEIVSCASVCDFQLDNQLVHYIVGVATKIEHRNNGCMHQLLKHIINRKEYTDTSFFLMTDIPEAYRGLGFKETYFKKKQFIESIKKTEFDLIRKQANSKDLVELYNQYVSSYSGYRLRNEKYYDLLFDRISCYQQKMLCYFKDTTLVGYVIIQLDTIITVTEIISMSTEYFEKMIQDVYFQFGAFYLYSSIDSSYQENYELIPVMYTLKYKKQDENPLFISEIM